jgi:hypothetical protein
MGLATLTDHVVVNVVKRLIFTGNDGLTGFGNFSESQRRCQGSEKSVATALQRPSDR